jgi:hypothetical protein
LTVASSSSFPKKKDASGSTKRRMNHAVAARLIRILRRVAHSIGATRRLPAPPARRVPLRTD